MSRELDLPPRARASFEDFEEDLDEDLDEDFDEDFVEDFDEDFVEDRPCAFASAFD